MKNKIIKWLGGYTSEEYDLVDYENNMQMQMMRLAKDHNHFCINLDELKKFFDEHTRKEIIKYSAATTKIHPTRNEWMYPKYLRPMHEYLKYDNPETEALYKELADEFLEKVAGQVDRSIQELSADEIVFMVQWNLLDRFKPELNYSLDIKEHGITDVWESPEYLYDKLYTDGLPGDCDSYMLMFHNILSECLAKTNPRELWRLQCVIIEYPNHTRHAINMWMKGDDVRYGVGMIPLETTMSPNFFKYDWNNNLFLTKGRYKIIHGFNNLREWRWI